MRSDLVWLVHMTCTVSNINFDKLLCSCVYKKHRIDRSCRTELVVLAVTITAVEASTITDTTHTTITVEPGGGGEGPDLTRECIECGVEIMQAISVAM